MPLIEKPKKSRTNNNIKSKQERERYTTRKKHTEKQGKKSIKTMEKRDYS